MMGTECSWWAHATKAVMVQEPESLGVTMGTATGCSGGQHSSTSVAL